MKYLLSLIMMIVSLLSFKANSQSVIGDGRLASEAVLDSPSGIAIDENDNVYIAERRGNRIRKIDNKTRIISTVVGTGELGFSGDGGLAVNAKIAHPELIAIDKKGNLIITDRSNSRIRLVNEKSGIIKTIVGTGESGYSGDGELAINAKISNPYSVLFDNDNNLFFADTENHVIRKVDSGTGVISTIAGNGVQGFDQDDHIATAARLNRPHSFVFLKNGNLVIGDSENQRIRIVALNNNTIRTAYGIGKEGFTEDGNLATEAEFGYFGSFVILNEMIIFSEWVNKRIRTIDIKSGILNSLKDDKGEPIEINGPYGMAFDNDRFLYVAEVNKNRVLKININSGHVERFAGK